MTCPDTGQTRAESDIKKCQKARVRRRNSAFTGVLTASPGDAAMAPQTERNGGSRSFYSFSCPKINLTRIQNQFTVSWLQRRPPEYCLDTVRLTVAMKEQRRPDERPKTCKNTTEQLLSPTTFISLSQQLQKQDRDGK